MNWWITFLNVYEHCKNYSVKITFEWLATPVSGSLNHAVSTMKRCHEHTIIHYPLQLYKKLHRHLSVVSVAFCKREQPATFTMGAHNTTLVHNVKTIIFPSIQAWKIQIKNFVTTCMLAVIASFNKKCCLDYELMNNFLECIHTLQKLLSRNNLWVFTPVSGSLNHAVSTMKRIHKHTTIHYPLQLYKEPPCTMMGRRIKGTATVSICHTPWHSLSLSIHPRVYGCQGN